MIGFKDVHLFQYAFMMQKKYRSKESWMHFNPSLYSAKWYNTFARYLLTTQKWQPLAAHLGGETLVQGGPREILNAQRNARDIISLSFSDQQLSLFSEAVTDFVSHIRPEAVSGPLQEDPLRQGQLSILQQDGYVHLPPIDSSLLGTIYKSVNSALLLGSQNTADVGSEAVNNAISPDALRCSDNLGHMPMEQVLALPGLLDIVADPATIALVRALLEAPPIITNVSVWRSFSGTNGAKEAKDAQLFHYDLDDYRFCKLFVYLTDVDAQSGPHIFFPETHRNDVILSLLEATEDLQRKEFLNWYASVLRKSEEDVIRWFNREPIAITGTAGSRFIVQTRGIHRGAPPETDDRVLLQCTYGITPYPSWGKAFDWQGFRDRNGRRTHTLKGWGRYLTDAIGPAPTH